MAWTPAATAPPPAAPAARLRAFAAAVRARYRHGRRNGVLVAVGVPAGLLLLGCTLWWPAATAAVAGIALGFLLLALLRARRAARREPLPELLAPLPLPQAAAVGDGLATWLERDAAGGAGEPMVAWLGDDLDHALAALPPPVARAAGRRRLGRVRYLVPLFAVLFVAWLLWQLWPPPIPGILTGKMPKPPAGGAAAMGSNGNGNGADNADGNSAPQPSTAGDPPPPPPPPPPPEPEPQPPPEPTDPEPLVQAPYEQQFVVPQFLGDGPSRKAMVRAAELDQGGGRSATAQPPPAGGAAPPLPQASDEQFQRAVEQALRSRHVPPAERPIVERFFHKLAERR